MDEFTKDKVEKAMILGFWIGYATATIVALVAIKCF